MVEHSAQFIADVAVKLERVERQLEALAERQTRLEQATTELAQHGEAARRAMDERIAWLDKKVLALSTPHGAPVSRQWVEDEVEKQSEAACDALKAEVDRNLTAHFARTAELRDAIEAKLKSRVDRAGDRLFFYTLVGIALAWAANLLFIRG